MTASQIYDMEKIVWELKKDGWEQMRGIEFFNSKPAVTLVKGGEAMRIEYDFYPPEGADPTDLPDACGRKTIGASRGRTHTSPLGRRHAP